MLEELQTALNYLNNSKSAKISELEQSLSAEQKETAKNFQVIFILKHVSSYHLKLPKQQQVAIYTVNCQISLQSSVFPFCIYLCTHQFSIQYSFCFILFPCTSRLLTLTLFCSLINFALILFICYCAYYSHAHT